MPVFISHRTVDDRIALTVYDRLRMHGITCYIDNVDALASRLTEREITSYIVQKLNDCTNLMAIVTPNTKGSWWVPFEIGVARQAPRIITSYYQGTQTELPEYLKEWPVLFYEHHIDAFAQLYKSQMATGKRIILERKSYPFESAEGEVNGFYRSLKASLGQR